jgi:biopolymer transport protein ExbD
MRPLRRLKDTGLRRNLALDLTPMVDVVFLLIIFFMVTTTFVTSEMGLPVDLPSAQSGAASPADVPTVTISRDQVIFFEDGEVPEGELVNLLRTRLAATPSGVVVLRADHTVPHGTAVRVMDLIKAAGAQQIAIATQN